MSEPSQEELSGLYKRLEGLGPAVLDFEDMYVLFDIVGEDFYISLYAGDHTKIMYGEEFSKPPIDRIVVSFEEVPPIRNRYYEYKSLDAFTFEEILEIIELAEKERDFTRNTEMEAKLKFKEQLMKEIRERNDKP